MAPAELARAGVIVWVSKGGGQMEIVGHEAALMDDSADDAVARITAVLADPTAQERLRHALAARAEMFSTDRFVAVDGGTLVEDTVLYSPIRRRRWNDRRRGCSRIPPSVGTPSGRSRPCQ